MRGWQIFPCHSIIRGRCSCSRGIACESPGKHPLTRNGVDDGTANLETVRAWEARYPQANWAVATGHTNCFIVIDIDPRNGGYDSIEDLEVNRPEGPLPDTLKSVNRGRWQAPVLPVPIERSDQGRQPEQVAARCRCQVRQRIRDLAGGHTFQRRYR